MTLFVSTHQAPALDPSEVQAYVPEIKKYTYAEFKQVWINLDKGIIVTLYEGDDEAAVRNEFDRIGWPVDTVNEVQYTIDRAGMDAIPA